MNTIYVICLTVFVNICTCDFYVGMFKEKDLLVAQDRLYKERIPYRSVYGKYGRIFKCPITYFRIVDRLGIGRGPKIEVIRGGLRHKYLVLRLKSLYNNPISVNIYVGCENKMPARSLSYNTSTTKSTRKPTEKSTEATTTTENIKTTDNLTTSAVTTP